MENKFYVPTIKEFHVGFEYDVYTTGTDTEYVKKIFTLTEVGFIQNVYDQNLQEGWFRVKYLDKEDIESLGFPIDEYFINKSIYGGTYKIEINTIGIVPKIIIKMKNHLRDGSGNFEELIIINRLSVKNKSELKKLLTQLEILNA
jgi:hypothetical protein